MSTTRIGLAGAGVIGRTHAALIHHSPDCVLVGIADPSDAARDLAASLGAAWYPTLNEMLDAGALDAVIIATPNDLHLPNALACIARGLPILVEKPVATTVEQGEALADAASRAGVAVLVGHHRRHNPIIAAARRVLREGALGELVTASVISAFAKPPEYFDLAWRTRDGTGGPVLINLIHEIDLIRFVCGEIASVQAITSNERRGYEVEDCASVLLRLTNNALVTVTLADCAASPWSWDLISGENPAHPKQPAPAQSHFICGTKASLALPTLDLWSYDGRPDWFAPIRRETLDVARANPYEIQLRHFLAVIAGSEVPLVGASDATQTLRATLAVKQAASSGQSVELVGR